MQQVVLDYMVPVAGLTLILTYIHDCVDTFVYLNNSIYWDTVCIETHSFLKKIIILTIILIGTY